MIFGKVETFCTTLHYSVPLHHWNIRNRDLTCLTSTIYYYAQDASTSCMNSSIFSDVFISLRRSNSTTSFSFPKNNFSFNMHLPHPSNQAASHFVQSMLFHILSSLFSLLRILRPHASKTAPYSTPISTFYILTSISIYYWCLSTWLFFELSHGLLFSHTPRESIMSDTCRALPAPEMWGGLCYGKCNEKGKFQYRSYLLYFALFFHGMFFKTHCYIYL